MGDAASENHLDSSFLQTLNYLSPFAPTSIEIRPLCSTHHTPDLRAPCESLGPGRIAPRDSFVTPVRQPTGSPAAKQSTCLNERPANPIVSLTATLPLGRQPPPTAAHH